MTLIMKEVVVSAQADGSFAYDLPPNLQRVEITGGRHGPPDYPVEHFRKGDEHVGWRRVGASEKGPPTIKLYPHDIDGLSVHGMARGDSVTLKIYYKEVA